MWLTCQFTGEPIIFRCHDNDTFYSIFYSNIHQYLKIMFEPYFHIATNFQPLEQSVDQDMDDSFSKVKQNNLNYQHGLYLNIIKIRPINSKSHKIRSINSKKVVFNFISCFETKQYLFLPCYSQELTPQSKEKYLKLTPRRREVFEEVSKQAFQKHFFHFFLLNTSKFNSVALVTIIVNHSINLFELDIHRFQTWQ